MTDQTVWARLREPFPAEDLEWRPGSTFERQGQPMALALPYVTARAIMDRLDEVVGPMDWSDSYRKVDGTKGWICRLEVLGYGHEDGADETDIEPTKGGISDALKRAAVKFGIGRYLYRLPKFYVPTKGQKPRIRLAEVPTLPPWALPGGSGFPDASAHAARGPAPPPQREEPRAPMVPETDPHPGTPRGDEALHTCYWNIGPNDQVDPAPLRPVGNDGLPAWFHQKIGLGKVPLSGTQDTVPEKDSTWAMFAVKTSIDGRHYQRMQWYCVMDPPNNQSYMRYHAERVARAKAALIWMHEQRKTWIEETGGGTQLAPEVPEKGEEYDPDDPF